MMGLSTRGSISLGCALVTGRKRVPSPAAGKTALQTSRFMSSLASVQDRTRESTRYHDWILSHDLRLARQLLQQRFQTRKHVLGLLLFQREFQDTRRRELAVGF